MKTNIPSVEAFFDQATNTISYVVSDPTTKYCAVIDSVLDYDAAGGCISHQSADALISYIKQNNLHLKWIIDSHVHADHLTAAQYIKSQLGGKTAIGSQTTAIQRVFKGYFNAENTFEANGNQFDHLFKDGESYQLGDIEVKAIHTPGHTPACMAHVFGDAVFVGDTLFMPDFGTARCDFPGGDASQLYQSIHRLFKLDDDTRMFLCHDYKGPNRDEYAWETTVGEQKSSNIHVNQSIDEATFVAMRETRDATLKMPALFMPSVQVNMRAGGFPEPDDNGQVYLKIPIN